MSALIVILNILADYLIEPSNSTLPPVPYQLSCCQWHSNETGAATSAGLELIELDINVISRKDGGIHRINNQLYLAVFIFSVKAVTTIMHKKKDNTIKSLIPHNLVPFRVLNITSSY